MIISPNIVEYLYFGSESLTVHRIDRNKLKIAATVRKLFFTNLC